MATDTTALLRLSADLDGADREIVIEAAKRIRELEDELDFRMADQLSTAVMRAIQDTIKRETGWDAGPGPFYVDNSSFDGVIIDPSPGGYKWFLSCHREERDAAEPSAG